MADIPQIKVSGAGTAREAARLGRQIGNGVTTALAGSQKPVHIDVLRLQLRSGAGTADVEAAIRTAIKRHGIGRER
jgi:hypothetical protein